MDCAALSGPQAARLRTAARGAVAILALLSGFQGQACAETLRSALARAYAGNPDLNQSRAAVRVRDEEAPKALAGMRPKANIQASVGPEYANLRFPAGRDQTTGQRQFLLEKYTGWPRGDDPQRSQNLFDGNRTENSVKQAESSVFAARAMMRLTEQAILQNGATAYMNVLRDTAVLNLRKNNISVLEQQLKQTQDRFQVGEVTRTDVAQAEASLAQARSEFYAAQAQLKNSVANYRQIIGVRSEAICSRARRSKRLLPKSLKEAIEVALVEHPGVVAALHQVDAAELAVKVAEARLLPTLSVNAQVSNQYDSFLGIPGSRQFSAGGGAAQYPALSGRRGIRLDPSGEGATRPGASERRSAARQRAGQRGVELWSAGYGARPRSSRDRRR